MKPVVSTAVMRSCDAAAIAAGTPARELMRRAGEGIYRSYPWRGPTAIVCGTGNNAGDGYVLALCLRRAGIRCRLLLCFKPGIGIIVMGLLARPSSISGSRRSCSLSCKTRKNHARHKEKRQHQKRHHDELTNFG